MLNFNEISIKDKPLFDEYIKLYNPMISEMTFTNFYMWRNFYRFRWIELEGLLCVISIPLDAAPFAFIPMGSLDMDNICKAAAGLKEHFQKQGWVLQFKRVCERDLELLRKFAKNEEDIILDRDSSDYVYLSENLTSLRGKKYDGKRNHINRFKKENDFEYVPITVENIGECAEIMAAWCAERNCEDHREFYCEKLANNELLNNYGQLGCTGALIRVNGRFEAFTVGEMLNDDTAVIHIEKANGKIHGLYTLINQQFCEKEWQKTVHINREQDLGVEGLRKAKLSYHPEKLIDKFTVMVR